MSPTPTLTFAQALFALTGFVIAPSVGYAGILAYRGTLLRPLSAFVFAATATGLGLVAGAIAAAWSFPEYPYVGPPERFAALFTLPAHAAAALALYILSRRPSSLVRPFLIATRDPVLAERGRMFAAVGLWVVATALTLRLSAAFVMPARLALPDSATRIRESLDADLFLGDYTYELEAEMSRDDFGSYSRSLEVPAADGADVSTQVDDCGQRLYFDGDTMRFEAWCM